MARLRYGNQEFKLDEICTTSEADRALDFADEFEAGGFLARLGDEPLAIARLRRHAAENLPGHIYQHNQTDIEFLRLRGRRLADLDEPLFKCLHECEQELLSGEGARETERDEPAEAPPAEDVRPPEEKKGIKFQVVDDATGKPYAGVVLRVRDSADWLKQLTTNARGIAEAKKVESGSCALTSDFNPSEAAERTQLSETFHVVRVDAGEEIEGEAADSGGRSHLAKIDIHKVANGESIASLADANSMRWQDLAFFNWGTDVPDRINDHLRDDVGCRTRTADGNNYIFTSADEPGLMYIPSEFRKTGLATEQTHIIRVKKIGAGA